MLSLSAVWTERGWTAEVASTSWIRSHDDSISLLTTAFELPSSDSA